jgi:chromosome segregation ATPase
MMDDNQTHAVGEIRPPVIDRLAYLWAVQRPAGKINDSAIYSITATGADMSAIADAGDRIIELEKQLESLRSELIRATNFELDATRLVRHEEMLNGFEDLWGLEEERASLEQRYATAQHAADCLEAKCNALEMDRNAFQDELMELKRKMLDPSANTNDELHKAWVKQALHLALDFRDAEPGIEVRDAMRAMKAHFEGRSGLKLEAKHAELADKENERTRSHD